MLKLWSLNDAVTLSLYGERDAGGLSEGWQNLASPAERERASKMGSPERAHTFLLSRALLRKQLAALLHQTPSDIAIELTPEGKPFLAGNMISFSLSHSHGFILIAYMRGPALLGVDVELMDLEANIEKVGQRILSPADLAELETITDGAKKRRRAFELWCLREARFKAGNPDATQAVEYAGTAFDDLAYAVCYSTR